MASSYTIQSVLRALDVLAWLAEHDGRGRITDIARDLGYSKNTVFRLLHTLMERDFVLQAEDSSYQLTFKLLNLGESVLRNTEVHDIARPFIQDLARKTGETATLAVLDNDEVIYLDRVLGSSHFNTSYSIGSRAKAHCTSLGKAILAFSPKETVARCLDEPLEAKTGHTITDPGRMRLELRETARRHYAIDNQENVLGIRCLGAPVFDRHGDVIAAISLSALAVNLSDERVVELAAPLTETAAAISSRLGYGGAYGIDLRADGHKKSANDGQR